MKIATQLVQRAEGLLKDAEPLTTPIYETTTFVFDSAQEVRDYNEGRSKKYLYTRYGNPTLTAVEQKIAKLEQAETAMLFASGQAATTTALIGLLKAGDEIVCSSAIYGGTLHLLADLLSKFGIRARFATLDELARPESVISDATRLAVVRVADQSDAALPRYRRRGQRLPELAASSRSSTTPSPARSTSSRSTLGVDIVMHSATKYLNGHSDVTAGVLAGPAGLLEPVQKARRMLGAILDPHAAYALGRGLKTLAGQDGAPQRHRAGGRAVARRPTSA